MVLFASSVCSLMEEAKMLCKLPDARDWWWEKLDLALVGRVVLSKTNLGTSLLVQWLTLRLPMHRVQV